MENSLPSVAWSDARSSGAVFHVDGSLCQWCPACLIFAFFPFIIVGENQRTRQEAGAPVSTAPSSYPPSRPLVPQEPSPSTPHPATSGVSSVSFCLRVAVSMSVVTTLGSSVSGRSLQSICETSGHDPPGSLLLALP